MGNGTYCGEMVDLVGLQFLTKALHRGEITKVSLKISDARVGFLRDAGRHDEYFLTLPRQQLRQVSSCEPGSAADERPQLDLHDLAEDQPIAPAWARGNSFPNWARSLSTIMAISSSNETAGSHPSSRRALE